MRRAFAVGFSVAALVMHGPTLAQTDPAEAVRNWTAITECGAITDGERRLACMDNVLSRAGARNGSTPQQARAEPLVPPVPPQQAPAAAAPSPSRSAGESRSAQPSTRVSGELTTTIASVQSVGFQRFLVTTAQGSAWEQTQAESFTAQPKVGDSFSVEPAAMGSFRCRFEQASRYRCRQVN